MDINILCVKWGDKFSADYVNKLYNMTQRNLTLPHKFICLTEDATDLNKGITPLPLTRNDLEYCWNKLILFEKKLEDLSGVGLFFDLDIVITDNIDDLFEYKKEDSFVGIMDWNRKNNPQFNASVMRYEIGKHHYIIDNFYEKVASGELVKKREWDAYLKSNDKVVYFENKFRYGGDQEWTSKQVYPPNEIKNHSFPEKWIMSYRTHGRNKLPQSCKIMVFHGDPKPHEAKEQYVKEYWK